MFFKVVRLRFIEGGVTFKLSRTEDIVWPLATAAIE